MGKLTLVDVLQAIRASRWYGGNSVDPMAADVRVQLLVLVQKVVQIALVLPG